jgi:hypothetical protein
LANTSGAAGLAGGTGGTEIGADWHPLTSVSNATSVNGSELSLVGFIIDPFLFGEIYPIGLGRSDQDVPRRGGGAGGYNFLGLTYSTFHLGTNVPAQEYSGGNQKATDNCIWVHSTYLQ